MPHAPRDDALSEVVGFVLILGVIVLALSLYQLYGVPAVGRENEILHMSAVKDRFIDYKISLDSLWLNSINGPNTLEGTTLSTSFDLGTEGGYTSGGGVIFPVLAPISSGGTLAINKYTDTISVSSTDGITTYTHLDSIPMGEVSFDSSNNYWIQQRYYYQMGGIMLAQDSGSTARVSPCISLSKVNTSVPGISEEYRLQLDLDAIQIIGYQQTTGKGVARLDTRLKRGLTQYPPSEGQTEVTVTINAHDANTAALWRQIFLDVAKRGGFTASTTEPDEKPVYIETNGNQVSLICRSEDGADLKRIQYVDFSLTKVEFSVTLQQVVTG